MPGPAGLDIMGTAVADREGSKEVLADLHVGGPADVLGEVGPAGPKDAGDLGPRDRRRSSHPAMGSHCLFGRSR